MAEAVPVNVSAGLPPANMQPGFVVPPAPANAASSQPADPAASAAPAAGGSDLNAAIAALTAALNAGKPAPAAEPAAEPAAVPFDDLNNFDVSSLDDPILRSMATVMQTVGKGLDLDRVLGVALSRGDPALVDAAYLREKAGPQAEQLLTIAQGIVQAVNAKSEQVTQDVYKLAGGQAQWDASVAALNASAPKELRIVIAQLLNSPNREQVDAGAKLVIEFGKGSGMLPHTSPSVNGGVAVAPGAAQALSKEEFQTELRKLNPNNRGYEQARNDLFARRQVGKQIGK